METQRLRIFLQDECPRIGCGWRTVTVAIGRKWVHLEDRVEQRARLPRRAYDAIAPSAIPAPKPRRRRSKR